jgi:hypothetical protein
MLRALFPLIYYQAGRPTRSPAASGAEPAAPH